MFLVGDDDNDDIFFIVFLVGDDDNDDIFFDSEVGFEVGCEDMGYEDVGFDDNIVTEEEGEVENRENEEEEDNIEDVEGGDEESLTAEQVVLVAQRRNLFLGMDVPFDLQPREVDEDQLVEDFMRKGCHCKAKFDAKSCSSQFDAAHVKDYRLSCRGLDGGQLEMLIMGQLSAFSDFSTVVATAQRHTPHQRKNPYSLYHHQGKAICREMFLFLHAIGKRKFENIQKHFFQAGITPRIHGNT